MTRRIAIFTGSRADYGLLKPVVKLCDESLQAELQLIVSGSHLSNMHGQTVSEIENDGFVPAATIDLQLGDDNGVNIAGNIGLAVPAYAEAMKRLQPDIVVILGDRYEAMAMALAAMCMTVPIAHIHGGELTYGAMDDGIRHAITKLAHIHFTARAPYRERVLQLGEVSDHTYDVGALGVEIVRRQPLLTQADLEAKIGFKFCPQNLLITHHPTTLDQRDEIGELLMALDDFPDVGIVFSLPNADQGNKAIRNAIMEFVEGRKHCVAFPSLGSQVYLSVMSQVDGVVGNSSSGIIEAPALGVWTVNVGTRQGGRLRAPTIYDVPASSDDIREMIAVRLSNDAAPDRSNQDDDVVADKYTSEKIFDALLETDLSHILQKKFIDFNSN